MTSKIVGIKEFRQNLATYTKMINDGNIRLIVLKKNVPVLEVKPVNERDFVFEKLKEEVKEAREQVKRGQIYSQDQIMEEFGLL